MYCCYSVAKSYPTLCNPIDCIHLASPSTLSMEFPKHGYWSGSPFPSPGSLPDAGTKPASPALAEGFFTSELPGKPNMM